jgi:hypothetical protein
MSEDKSASQFLSDYRLALECLKSNEKELLPDRVIDALVNPRSSAIAAKHSRISVLIHQMSL